MNSESIRVYLVRTPGELVDRSIVGVGWSEIDFSQNENAEMAIQEINNTYGIGRRANQVRRFFQIREGDLIVTPLPWSVAIGRARGEIFYDVNYEGEDRCNQRRVDFLRDDEGQLVRLPRSAFSEAFQRRLRVQGMTVNDLTEFSDEVLEAFAARAEGRDFSWTNKLDESASRREADFRSKLLANIQNGKTNLQAGGIGLEELVRELLEIEGYTARILPKTEFESGADADVVASRSDRFTSVELLVQVKHHYGYSNEHGITQLENIRRLGSVYQGHQLVLLTSASVSDALEERAESAGVMIVDGEGLVGWIAEHVIRLSPKTRNTLGIRELPVVVFGEG